MSDGREWSGPDGQRADQPVHVVPLNDLREHIANGDPCPCLPRTVRRQPGGRLVSDPDAEGERADRDASTSSDVIVHNSYDRRETGEVCRLALDLLGKALVEHQHTWSDREREAYEHAIHVLDMHWPAKPSEKRP